MQVSSPLRSGLNWVSVAWQQEVDLLRLCLAQSPLTHVRQGPSMAG